MPFPPEYPHPTKVPPKEVPMPRQPFIAAYDIACPRRLHRALAVLHDFATGGQRSCFECFLSEGERRELLARMDELLDPAQDRFFLLRLDPRSRIATLGRGVTMEDPLCYWVG